MREYALIMLGLVAFGTSTLSASVIFDDTFTSNAPGYYLSADGGTLAVGSGKLTFTETTSTSLQSVFKQFAATTLADGDTLRLSVDITDLNIGNATNQLRITMGNSPTTFSSNQAVNVWSSTTTGYVFNFGTGSNTADSVRRLNISSSPGSILSGASSSIGTGVGTITNGNSQNLILTFDVTRLNSSTFTVNAKIGGTSVFSGPVDTATFDYGTFNTIAIGINNGTSGRYIGFDQISLALVPEPSSLIMLALGTFCVWSFRRLKFLKFR